MTTILATRDFIITDCRVTSLRANYQYRDKIHIDNRCKIEVDCTVIHEGKRIVAAAACGDVSASSHLKHLIKDKSCAGIELETIVKILNGMPVRPGSTLDYELVCLTEDGECAIVSNDIIHSGSTEFGRARTVTRLLKNKSLSDGLSSVVFGSGSSIFDILKDRIDTAELSFVDIFYFAAGLDPNSSNSYSVYSRVTNELFTTVNPTKQDIAKRINRVLKKINFTDPKYKKKNSVNL